MTVEINTPHRDYPLPHQNNLLEQDVLRLIQALTQIDVDVEAQQQGQALLQQALEQVAQVAQGSDAKLEELKSLLNQRQVAHQELHRKQKINHLLGESLYPL
ncbi:hypothetical protein PSECIP111854_02062 [Pseudoalteromonas sp. CIP111854]|uniref:Uncharacterized protein n=1 Tax=Pseudoalteromonas holothuriae TaxID=2963714 RepID=A0A9W4VQN1_9GAMM|nr:hypothetical protein [Pseudoalteromonas sp. CIP111854]CAH9057755.1 hypothetical protein PSECIP111854_02062 [Pseudoalteromonas sp. CIP111854]